MITRRVTARAPTVIGPCSRRAPRRRCQSVTVSNPGLDLLGQQGRQLRRDIGAEQLPHPVQQRQRLPRRRRQRPTVTPGSGGGQVFLEPEPPGRQQRRHDQVRLGVGAGEPELQPRVDAADRPRAPPPSGRRRPSGPRAARTARSAAGRSCSMSVPRTRSAPVRRGGRPRGSDPAAPGAELIHCGQRQVDVTGVALPRRGAAR